MNAIEQPKFTYTSSIAAAPDKVWEALTSPGFTEKYWSGRHIVSNWKPGGSVQLLKPDGSVDWEGEVIKATAPSFLAFTFQVPRVEPGATEPPSHVAIELAEEGAGTRLTLAHDGFEPASKVFESIAEGWPAVLNNLKSLLETGKAVTFPGWKDK